MNVQGHVHRYRRALGSALCLALLLLGVIPLAQAAPQWQILTFDDTPTSPNDRCASLALDSSGIPHIVYEAGDGPDVRYAVRDGDSWDVQTIATSIGTGSCSVSLTLDRNDQPHVAFYATLQQDLDYATLSGGNWNIETVDSDGDVGYYVSLALDSNGNPHISYFDDSNDDLKYAVNNGNGWITSTVDGNGEVGWYTSLALDSNDQPHIAYYDYFNARVLYASWSGAEWEIQTVDTNIGGEPYISLKLDENDVPHIAYGNDNPRALKYAVLTNGSWSVETVSPSGFPVAMPSLALDAVGVPHIAYYGALGELVYAVKTDNGWDLQAVYGDSVSLASLALDSQGRAHIAAYDFSILKYLYAEEPEQAEDSTPPVTNASATTPGDTPYTFGTWTNQSVSVTLSAMDNDGSGVANTYYTIDNSDQQTYSAPFTISSEGAHTLRFWSVDNDSNVETAHEKSINIDLTPPSIAIDGNQGSYAVDQTVDITCTPSDQADLSGLASSNCQEITGAAADFGAGAHTFNFKATDNAGNVTTVDVTFTVSVTPDSLCSLTDQYASDARAAQQLCAPLGLVQLAERMHNPSMKASAINSYILLVNTQRGQSLSNSEADTLISLAQAL